MSYKLIDTHAHLDFSAFDKDRELIINKTRENKVAKIINIGISFSSTSKSIQLAKRYRNIYATVGLHPSQISILEETTPLKITHKLHKIAQNKKVVAIGECGLDYFRIKKNDEKIKLKQKLLFKLQTDLAKDFNLPLIIHSRNAFDDVIKLLEKHHFPFTKTLFHSWSYDCNKAKQITDKGGYIAFNAIVTYLNAKNIQETAAKIPTRNFVLETDAPYLSPQKTKGQRNEPKNIIETAKQVAKLRNTSVEEIAHITTQNAISFFNLE